MGRLDDHGFPNIRETACETSNRKINHKRQPRLFLRNLVILGSGALSPLGSRVRAQDLSGSYEKGDRLRRVEGSRQKETPVGFFVLTKPFRATVQREGGGGDQGGGDVTAACSSTEPARGASGEGQGDVLGG